MFWSVAPIIGVAWVALGILGLLARDRIGARSVADSVLRRRIVAAGSVSLLAVGAAVVVLSIAHPSLG